MKSNLLFDYTVNKNEKTIRMVREFEAGLQLVWDAWTKATLLDQWWGPEPYRAETKVMDFRVGGYWLYAMVSPEGDKHWGKADFVSIENEKSFTMKGGFSDENGVLNLDFPQNEWQNTFIPKDNGVRVEILLTYNSVKDLEAEIEMGFLEGMSVDFQQLDALLPKLKV
ncbi:SRPBCC family protein [Sphingobacterium tabacisoli]|uniref:SRPBCC domain-containing protein n=1 Tax=Sphingobacterium tabacisoli TaxID=2044855 RepID=A0ABW5L4V8_9SPHI|nr:SRPBCC domain-containing protein [Sphingobacterium tabacisoli]